MRQILKLKTSVTNEGENEAVDVDPRSSSVVEYLVLVQSQAGDGELQLDE